MLLLVLFPLTRIPDNIYYAESIPYAPTLGLPECHHLQNSQEELSYPSGCLCYYYCKGFLEAQMLGMVETAFEAMVILRKVYSC